MAKTSDRQDPKKNKSLAIRTVLKEKPRASAADIVVEVKKQFGHEVKPQAVYMAKTKRNIRKANRKSGDGSNGKALSSIEAFIEAQKTGKKLLHETGGLTNAIALLKAIES